jgi:hypothetical protein
MSPYEILNHLDKAAVIVEAAEDGRLRVRALLDDHPLTADTLDFCREHKPELLDYARFAREADALLLASTRAFAKQWPPGCELDSEWDRLEREVHSSYWTCDPERLQAARADRDAHALQVFAAYRGRAAVQDPTPQDRRTVRP